MSMDALKPDTIVSMRSGVECIFLESGVSKIFEAIIYCVSVLVVDYAGWPNSRDIEKGQGRGLIVEPIYADRSVLATYRPG
jgi:hypothetical protein